MGNSQTKEPLESVTLLQDRESWILMDNLSTRNHYKNRRTNQEAEQYILNGQISQRQQLEYYQYRKNANNNIVKVFLFEKEEKKGGEGNIVNYKVLVEFIKYRLHDIAYFTIEQALFVLRETLKGYKQIYEIFGFIKITQKMIGINCFGMIKVWVTSQFEHNKPMGNEKLSLQMQKQFKNNVLAQPTMISNIINVVNMKLKQQKYPQDFASIILKMSSFQNAIEYIGQYIKQNKLLIPDRLTISTQNKISLVINPSYKKKLSLKQQQIVSNPPPLLLHRGDSSKNLNQFYRPLTQRQRILSSSKNYSPQVVFNNKIIIPPLPLSSNCGTIQNSENKIQQPPHISLSNRNINFLRSNQKQMHKIEESSKIQTPRHEKIQASLRYSKFQNTQPSFQSPSKPNKQIQIFNTNNTLLSNKNHQEITNRESSQIDDITNRIQGLIKGSGVIQNIRSSPDRKKQKTESTSFERSSNKQFFESPLRKCKQKIYDSNDKKYSYSTYFDQELNLRSTINSRQKYFPKISWDSDQKQSLKSRLQTYRIQGNKNYLL